VSASQFYTGLVAELYGPLRSEVPDPELYARFVERSGEPALELGCGTGDPILALRQRGLDVDGVDSSADMLAICRARAEAQGVTVDLYEQAMEALALPRRYRSIYLAGPTFNLLADDDTALAALEGIASHLERDEPAAALVPLFIPEPTPDQSIGVMREHVTEDGRLQRVGAISEIRDENARTQTTVLRYESIENGVSEVLERPWQLHWHTQEGFAALVTAAGLTVTAVRSAAGGAPAPDAGAFAFFLANSGSIPAL
jgi:SAM-dependent methyltransferase